MELYVTFWGVRGSIPTPGTSTHRFGGNTACIEMRIGDDIYIFDAGSGVRQLGAKLLSQNSNLTKIHMFFSLSHWDHIQGLPFLPQLQCDGCEINVWAPVQDDGRSARECFVAAITEPVFPVALDSFGAQIAIHDVAPSEWDIGSYLSTSLELTAHF